MITMAVKNPMMVFTWIIVEYMSAHCTASFPSTQRERQIVFSNLLLHQSYPRCGSVDFISKRITCEVWDMLDEENLLHLGERCTGGFKQYANHLSLCSDGSANKTCVPHVADPDAFTCACKTMAQEPVSHLYKWDAELRQMAGPRQGLYRKLCNQVTWSCVAAEYRFGLAHLVKHTKLPDDRITASSIFDRYHPAKGARIDKYFGPPCAWASSGSDLNKWLGFDMIKSYTGVGILLRKRCGQNYGQKTTKVKVGVSRDSSNWQFSEDIDADYGMTESSAYWSFTYWFQQPLRGRYWRIYPLEWESGPTFKADIIGKV